jgi:hypothetical protein
VQSFAGISVPRLACEFSLFRGGSGAVRRKVAHRLQPSQTVSPARTPGRAAGWLLCAEAPGVSAVGRCAAPAVDAVAVAD